MLVLLACLALNVPTPQRAQFVAPAEGAVFSGTCAVGVELTGPSVVGLGQDDLPMLVVPGLGEVDPLEVLAVGRGVERRLMYEVDADSMPAGAQVLRLRFPGTPPIDIVSERPLLVQVVHDATTLVAEAEAALDIERPEEFGERHPSAVGDAEASGGLGVVSRGYSPTALATFELPPGDGGSRRYQPYAVMRGRIGAGAFPSAAVVVGDNNARRGAVRVIAEGWHRLPVGLPIDLGAGPQVIGLRHANPIQEGRAEQRHLYIDRIELVEVDAGVAAPDAMMSMDSMSMMSSTVMTTAADPGAPLPEGLWVGFQEVFDGLPMNGDLRIEAKASWRDGPNGAAPAPRVALLVDGAAVRVVQGSEPVFRLTRDELGAGTHTIQLRAIQAGGREALSPLQTLEVRGRTGLKSRPVTRRYGAADEAWEKDGSLGRPAGPVAATLELPEDLWGSYELRLDARGPGAPEFGAVQVRVEGPPDEHGERALFVEKDLEVQNWWSERLVGRVELPKGPKRVVLHADPRPDGSQPKSEGEKPSLYLRSLILEDLGARPSADHSPPGAAILYPSEGAAVDSELDAVVADVFDDHRVKTAELLVDGRPVSSFARVPEGAGYAVLPLLTHALSPGEHELRVRVFDDAGNESESLARRILVTAESPRFRRAVHLLNRFGFGPDPRELAEVLVNGEAAWLDSELGPLDPSHVVARGRARAELGGSIPYGASQFALRIALTTGQPVRERFALFIDNHFSTWGGKTGVPSEWGDHRRYQDAGLAPFHSLLTVALTSPVMLVYLDQEKSFRGRLNENLARELLELHTVGVDGGYTQTDVTALASLLCGLTVAQEAPPDGSGKYLSRVFRFAPDLADPSAQVVLGESFEGAQGAEALYGRFEKVLAFLAAHPMTSRHFAQKMAEHFVASPAPAQLVEDLTQAFLDTGGDPAAMLRLIAEHDDFWAAMDEPRIASPLDFGLRFGRATVPRHLHGQVDSLLKSAGMGLFDRPTPDGYPEEDEVWVDSNGLLARWRLAQSVAWAARALVPEKVRHPDQGTTFDSWAGSAVDHAAFRFLGRRLSPDSREAAIAYLADIADEPTWKRIDQLCVLITRFPEANLR